MQAGADGYVGRFAPSPTGSLHFGSLVAALASFLDARHNHGKWLLRMENIDPPREVAGAASDILSTLERWHLEWDGEVLYQSSRIETYRDYAHKLLETGAAFRCRCSRKDLRSVAGSASGYPGTCREAQVSADDEHCLRIRSDDLPIQFIDTLQGKISADRVEDFIIWRRDGLCAYQLAVTVDDQWQQITHIVRGADLLDSTTRQLLLRRVLNFKRPRFAHVPMVVHPDGQKLSKQTGAKGLDRGDASNYFFLALNHLRQEPPEELAKMPVREQIEWATINWDINKLKGISRIDLGPEEKNIAY